MSEGKVIFLCHASEDKPDVRSIYRRLNQAGFDLWFDEECLLPGHDWRQAIQGALRNSVAVVVCLSDKSVNKRGYVQREIRESLEIAAELPEGSLFIVPIRLSDCVVPESLRRWHYVNLYELTGFYKLVRALTVACPQCYSNGTLAAEVEQLSQLVVAARTEPSFPSAMELCVRSRDVWDAFYSAYLRQATIKPEITARALKLFEEAVTAIPADSGITHAERMRASIHARSEFLKTLVSDGVFGTEDIHQIAKEL